MASELVDETTHKMRAKDDGAEGKELGTTAVVAAENPSDDPCDGVATIHRILPSLYLGAAPLNDKGERFSDSNTLDVLRKVGVTHVLNCTPDYPFPTVEDLPTLRGTLRVEAEDVDRFPIGPLFRPGAAFINDAITSSGCVYVHCQSGKSRSASLVVAYRLLHRGESLNDAYNDTHAKRAYAEPRPSFFEELAALEVELGAVAPSLTVLDYWRRYLKAHFAPYCALVEGLSDATVDSIIDEVGEGRAAQERLMELVNASM